MVRTVEFEGMPIRYNLERKAVKNVNLRIRADGRVLVSAAKDVPTRKVDDFVKSKGAFILRSLSKFAEKIKFSESSKNFVNGESIALLGRNLRLRVKQGVSNAVEDDESYVTLTVKDVHDRQLKEKILNSWLRKKCKEEISEICKKFYPKVKKYGVPFPEIRLRQMVSRWGSCQQKKGVLVFNTALIAVPISCIEYVVTHEFIHFLEPNHSASFYQKLSTFMPDWQERKARLEKGWGEI
ncbi:MAG: M48 family metallopeptidase [Fibrobacter sp.]|nr:M48 family metallopeptidase [Fibrobacter sp.]